MRSDANTAALALIVGILTPAIAQQDQDVISLERTSCFGTCPVYSLRIDSYGNLSYKGEKWVATQGTRTSQFTANQFQDLVEGFAKIRFFELNDVYKFGPRGIFTTDRPTALIGLTRGGKTKTITDYDYTPPELRELERTIERTANVHNWIHDETARLTLNSPLAGTWLGGIEDLKNEQAIWADASARIKPGMTPLMQAAGLGNATVIGQAQSGESVNAADETGWTALMIASVAVQPQSVSALLDAGARVDQRDLHGDTALIGAAAVRFRSLRQAAEIVGNLLAHGASVEATNDLGESALMWAARAGNSESINVLLKAAANPARVDQSGHDALFYLRRARDGLTFDKALVERYNQAESVLEQR
jgi:Domain of unknown function (DUF6438)/Ankyrin repeat